MADREAQLRLRLTAQNEANPALTGAADAMKSLMTVSEEVSKAVKASFESMSTVASQSGLKKPLQEDEMAFQALAKISKESTEALDKSFQSMETVVSSVTMAIRNQTRELSEAMSTNMKNAKTSTEESSKGIKNAITDAGLLIGLQQLGQSMKDIGSKGDALFKDAIHSAAEFEGSISRIHAVLMNREPEANMKAMQEAALKLGSNSKFSANEIAQGMYDLARQGLSSTQILGDGINGAIEVVNNLAQSVDGDMGETAKVITDVMHEFGLSGEQLAKVGDMISGTMHTSSISMNDFYYSMRQVGPVASNMHQSIEDVSTTIALLAQHGISGSSAGTALKNMLLGLEPRTAKAAELMKDLGISAKEGAADSFYKLNGDLKPLPDIIGILSDKFGGLNDKQKEAALAATFTKYGLAGLNTIVGEGKEKFEELKKTLMEEKSADIAREKLNNLQGDMLRLKAATETMSKSFGDTLQPAMRGIAQAVQGVIQWFTNLSPTTKEVIMVVGGIASAMVTVGGAILGAVSAIGFLSMGLEGLGLTFGAILGPIGIVIGAVAALGFAAYELIAHWDQVSAWMKHNLGIDIPQIWNSLKNTADTVFKAIGEVFSTVWDAIKQTTKDVWDYVGPTIVDGIKEVSDYWNEIWPKLQQVFEGVWVAIKFILAPVLAFLWIEISAALGFIKGAWHDVWNAIKDAFKLVWDLIVDILRLAWDVVSGIFKVALDLLTGHWSDAWNDMKSMLGNIWEDIKKLFGHIVENALSFGKDLVMGVAHGIEGAIDAVISAAKKVISAITSIFSSAPKAPTVEAPSYGGGDAISQAAESLPAFGDGGKVTKPTLAMVGERGEAEYIIPESRLTGQGGYTMGLSGLSFGGGGRGGNTVNGGIHIHVSGAGKDGQRIGSDIMTVLRREMGFSM